MKEQALRKNGKRKGMDEEDEEENTVDPGEKRRGSQGAREKERGREGSEGSGGRERERERGMEGGEEGREAEAVEWVEE
eukprot:1310830-Rhodomonas_salina.2